MHTVTSTSVTRQALLTLRNQLFNEPLMSRAALGLVVFGIYGLCEASLAAGLNRRITRRGKAWHA